MVKIIILFLLAISSLGACHYRQKNIKTPTEPSPAPTTLDAANNTNPDSLKKNAATAADSLTGGKTNPFLISPTGAGIVKINMSVTALKEMVPPDHLKEVTLQLEGGNYKAYEIKNQATEAQAALLVEERCSPTCRVWRLQVLDSAYHTPEGIGVGATLGEVKKHYPISYLGPGETGVFAASVNRNISFELDTSGLPSRQVQALNLKNAPNHLRVKRILIF